MTTGNYRTAWIASINYKYSIFTVYSSKLLDTYRHIFRHAFRYLSIILFRYAFKLPVCIRLFFNYFGMYSVIRSLFQHIFHYFLLYVYGNYAPFVDALLQNKHHANSINALFNFFRCHSIKYMRISFQVHYFIT